jgi:hypothetical protein
VKKLSIRRHKGLSENHDEFYRVMEIFCYGCGAQLGPDEWHTAKDCEKLRKLLEERSKY